MSSNHDPYKLVTPRMGSDDFNSTQDGNLRESAGESILNSFSNYFPLQQHVNGLRAVVPATTNTVANVNGCQSLSAYLQAQVGAFVPNHISENVRFIDDTINARSTSLNHQQAPVIRPKSAMSSSQPSPVLSIDKFESYPIRSASHVEIPTKLQREDTAQSLHNTVMRAKVERILARPEKDSYRSYCTRKVKGLRLNSPPIKPRCIQEQDLTSAPYIPCMRSRTQRRKDEQEEEERRKEENKNREPVRRNPDGTPCYATVSHHKELFDKALEAEKKRRDDYEEHCRRIRQDRSSLVIIKDSNGAEYKYNERGFKVPVSEYVKPRVPTPPKIEYHGPYFRGEILHKTQSYVDNMRRMVKLRYEQAHWDSCSFPWSTFFPGLNTCQNIYAPKNAVPGSAFHRDVLKYGNTHANSSSKFVIGNAGKKYIGAQLGKSRHQGDVDLLPLSYFRSWPEFAFLQAHDVVITIEHCHNCHRHQFKTRHDSSKYLNLAREYRDILIRICAQFVCKLSIYLKPIEDHDPLTDWAFHHPMDYSHIINGHPGKSGGDKNSFTRVDVLEKIHFETDTNRCGAFEIQVALKNSSGQSVNHILFSKLFYGAWPSRKNVATLMDSLLSENLKRLPSDLPLHFYSDKLSNANICENILDTRTLSDPSAFVKLQAEEKRSIAKMDLQRNQNIERENLESEYKRLEAQVSTAEKRLKNAEAKVTSIHKEHAESLKNNKAKAKKAAEIQHRSWGAALNEDTWEKEYEEIIAKNAPAVSVEQEAEITAEKERESLRHSIHEMHVINERLITLADKHRVEMHELEKGFVPHDAQVGIPSREPLAETNTQEPEPAKKEEITINNAATHDMKNEVLELQMQLEHKLRSEIQAQLAVEVQAEMQRKLESAIQLAKHEAEVALSAKLEQQMAVERAQREAMENEVKLVRERAATLERQMEEKEALRLIAENEAALARAAASLAAVEAAREKERQVAEVRVKVADLAQTLLSASQSKEMPDAVPFPQPQLDISLALNKSEPSPPAINVLSQNVLPNEELSKCSTHALQSAADPVASDADLDLNINVDTISSIQPTATFEEFFAHDENFWDMDSADDAGGHDHDAYAEDEFEQNSGGSGNEKLENLLFDD